MYFAEFDKLANKYALSLRGTSAVSACVFTLRKRTRAFTVVVRVLFSQREATAMIGVQIADLLEKMSIQCGGDIGHGIQQIAQAEKMWEQKQLEIVSAFTKYRKKRKISLETLAF